MSQLQRKCDEKKLSGALKVRMESWNDRERNASRIYVMLEKLCNDGESDCTIFFVAAALMPIIIYKELKSIFEFFL